MQCHSASVDSWHVPTLLMQACMDPPQPKDRVLDTNSNQQHRTVAPHVMISFQAIEAKMKNICHYQHYSMHNQSILHEIAMMTVRRLTKRILMKGTLTTTVRHLTDTESVPLD